MKYYQNLKNTDFKICSKCIYDERMDGISFDNEGVCNYCHKTEELIEEYGTGKKKGEKKFEEILAKIKTHGRKKKYDCIIGVSGGTDSSFLLYKAVTEWGLRPLAVHFDNTWNTSIATMNIQKILKPLDIDLFTYVVDNKEIDDIYKSFFLAGVPEIDCPTDLGFAYTLRLAASKFKIKYILEGHTFIEEGITPLGVNYFDGKYIKSIHNQYGQKKMKSYKLMTFTRFLKSILFDQIKFIRPLWYIKYSKKEAQEILKQRFGWEYYGGHHLENRMPAYYHGAYLPSKFNTDLRNHTLSAQVRSNLKTREQAWQEYNFPPKVEEGLIDYFKKRLNLTDEVYEKVMRSNPKKWTDFPTYKKRFEFLKPLFFIFAKLELVPMSFYIKYCNKIKNKDDKNNL